eukprot:993725_1
MGGNPQIQHNTTEKEAANSKKTREKGIMPGNHDQLEGIRHRNKSTASPTMPQVTTQSITITVTKAKQNQFHATETQTINHHRTKMCKEEELDKQTGSQKGILSFVSRNVTQKRTQKKKRIYDLCEDKYLNIRPKAKQ